MEMKESSKKAEQGSASVFTKKNAPFNLEEGPLERVPFTELLEKIKTALRKLEEISGSHLLESKIEKNIKIEDFLNLTNNQFQIIIAGVEGCSKNENSIRAEISKKVQEKLEKVIFALKDKSEITTTLAEKTEKAIKDCVEIINDFLLELENSKEMIKKKETALVKARVAREKRAKKKNDAAEEIARTTLVSILDGVAEAAGESAEKLNGDAEELENNETDERKAADAVKEILASITGEEGKHR